MRHRPGGNIQLNQMSAKSNIVSGTDPRKDALCILTALNDTRKTLDLLLEDMDKHEYKDSRDRALLNTLVYGVLRWKGKLDWVIQYFSHIRLKKIDPKVLNILRLGLFQILYLDRVPVSAAVNTSVELTKQEAAPWIVKFVNAVMRKMSVKPMHLPDPFANVSCTAGMSVEKSFPEWLIIRWVNRFGIAETKSLCDAINELPPITVRTNTLRTDREQLQRELETSVEQVYSTPHAPEGLSLIGTNTSIGRIPAFTKGLFQVQDEAAQLIAHLTGPQPGESILDACAGRGGKTGHLAQLMENKGQIVAMDINADKLRRLQKEMERLGIGIVTTVTADLNAVPALGTFNPFDRILLDAPCSGLGVLRRNPDTKWRVSEKDLKRNGQRQVLFLDHLSHLLKPGGILVYVVCSTEPEENEAVVEKFLASHANYGIAPVQSGCDSEKVFLTDNNCYRSFPHRHRMDGFFGARFRRRE
ncbi:MAG: 16S rRNA (cytosine(967)-C(5))-methyltransferase RsmB [Desulfobacterales bacterium]|jgi:16S rRNA (cytosine967-C5)-methyltransferase|nr:16S rRNA (cytosine(967)-C(5))-methyltransferase RsmB [Desulfobacterales bacterium]